MQKSFDFVNLIGNTNCRQKWKVLVAKPKLFLMKLKTFEKAALFIRILIILEYIWCCLYWLCCLASWYRSSMHAVELRSSKAVEIQFILSDTKFMLLALLIWDRFHTALIRVRYVQRRILPVEASIRKNKGCQEECLEY